MILSLLLTLALPAVAQSPAPLGELFASEPGAPAVAQPAGAGMSVMPGSEVSAGITSATLKLARGGQIRICPKSSLNVNASGQGLMVGMNTGAIEVEYRLSQGATDILLTPDFSIRLAGPAAYHFALGATGKGDTCVKPLAGNGAAVLFSELMGPDTYGVATNEGALFPGGRIALRTPLTSECGCPVISGTPVATEIVDPLPADRPGSTHLEVSTPFVFSATAAGDARPNVVAHIQFSSLPNVFFLQEETRPVVLVEKAAEVSIKEEKPQPEPAQQAKKQKKGFMARMKGIFGSVFHR